MSVITDVILVCGGLEGLEILKQIESLKVDEEPFRIVSIEDPKLPINWYGGSKKMYSNVFIGSYNHLNVDSLIKVLKGMSWESPEDVQLIIRPDGEFKFKIMNLFEE